MEHDAERPARTAVEALLDLAEPAARRLGCAPELELVRRILDDGNGATEQRAAHAESGSLLAVAQHLAETTVAGV